MANVDAAFGFRPVRHYFGGLVRANRYEIATSYGTSLFTGDPVKSTGTTKQIEIAATSSPMLGIFAGCRYTNSAGDLIYSRYWPASTVLKSGTVCDAYVYDDPFILFEAQMSGSLAVTDIAQTADFVAGTGDTATGISRYEVNSTGIGTAEGFVIVDYVRDGVNAIGTTNTKVLVMFSEHEFRPAAIVGV